VVARSLRGFAHLLWFATVALLASLTHAQQRLDVTTAPPTITFPAWRAVGETEDAVEYSVTFPSAVTTPYLANNSVPLRVFVPEPPRGPVPVVVILHYWGAADLKPEVALASELNRRGIAAAVLTLPYHLSRTPPGRRSGDMAIEPDVERMKETTLQSVWDVRRTLDFLATRPELDMSRVGIMGTSLGALVTALVYATDERVHAASFLLGGVDFAQILWSSSRVVLQRDALRRRGFTEERLREALADIEPANYLESRRGGRAFVIGARFDTVVPRQSTEQLIARLGDPKVLWLDTGHYGGIFVQRRVMREVAGYFSGEFYGTPFQVPGTVYAPTLRLGIKADLTSGFDVAAGIDLLRLDARGEGFASLLLTPRGPGLFIGRKINESLAAGGIVTPRGAGLGIFWSTVL
jgi:hypothetical protein